MRNVLLSLLLATMVAGVTAVQQPSFAGDWVEVAVPGPHPCGPICGQACTITQTAKTLTVKRSDGNVEEYALDGSRGPRPLGGPAMTATLVSTAVWRGATLEITTSIFPIDGTRSPVDSHFTLAREGDRLVVRAAARDGTFGTQEARRVEYQIKK